MSDFEVHTKETAPTESAQHLASAEKAYGFIPNLLGVMAESPATLGAYLSMGLQFEQSSFSVIERQIIMLTTSRFKTLSNYVNHVAGTPLDDVFATQAWVPIVD